MTIAHLLVTLIYIPKEIVYNITVIWMWGDITCRLCKFFDVFSVVLSANILVCLSLDRFFSILYPLYSINAKKHVLRMITVPYLFSRRFFSRVNSHNIFPKKSISRDVFSYKNHLTTFFKIENLHILFTNYTSKAIKIKCFYRISTYRIL